MSSSFNRVLLVLVGVALLGIWALQSAATAQPVLQKQVIINGQIQFADGKPGGMSGEDPNAENNAAISFPTDNKLKRKLEAAQDFIKEELWGEAVDVLQDLLNRIEDVMVQVGRRGPDGKEIQQRTSIKAEANRLLGSLPKPGMETYRVKYGPKAADLLKQAITNNDRELLAQVSISFFYTDAGAEATNLLGTYYLDRGNYVTAAEAFKRLLERQGSEKLSPTTLYKAFLAFSEGARRSNSEDEQRADLVWRQLSTAAPEGLRFADRLIPLDTLHKQRDRLSSGVTRNPNDWLVFGGRPDRSAQGNGGTPFLEYLWKQPTMRSKDTARFVMGDGSYQGAVKQRELKGEAILPSFFPVAAKGKLIYRSYWGIHAVDLHKEGKLVWEMPSFWSMDHMLTKNNKTAAITQWINMYNQMGRQNVFYENSNVGTLSTDNTRVYCVEDLAVPPVNVMAYGNPWGANPNLPWGQEINQAIHHSKLQAIDLENGKFLWEVGGPVEKKDGVEVKEGIELKDSFFLGPPLPLGGKLYVLNEKNQELRLVCLDAARGTINWTQTLASTRDKLVQDVGRRVQAAQLSYGEGILICPTNAGAIIGVDLLTHSLQWVYLYREKGSGGPTAEEQALINQGIIINPRGRGGVQPFAGSNEWKTAAPIVQDGKVVFTAPDGSSVHCLNLRDGSLVWKSGRGDKDLYLAGVYNGKVVIVGKETARALSLVDGKQIWQVPTGMPSGRGIASDNIYYLPLKSAVASKEPEVCAIDIEKGIVSAHTKSRKKMGTDGKEYQEVPGNLLFYEGTVISQTVNEIVAYPQLKVKLKLIDERLAKDDKNPEGLIERGELRLDEGNLVGAVTDLRTALENNPPERLIPKAKLKLYESLTELLQRDFSAAEKYLDEYKGLCKVEIAPDATTEVKRQLEAENQTRQANYLCLLAKGREAQNRFVDAFDAYQEFGVVAANRELISVVDEPSVKARPDVWAQGRIAAMILKAKKNPDHRKELEDRIAQKYQEVKKKGDIESLRQFAGMFGSLFEVGKEAWLTLAERLVEEQGGTSLLEAERYLLVLRHQKDDPQLAGRAVEALARLMARRGLLEDAAFYYRVLGREFAKVEVRDGKTGSEIFDELATDKRFLPYLDEPGQVWQGGKIKSKDERGVQQQPQQQNFAFQPGGEVMPFFQQHRIALNLAYHQFKLIDRSTNEEKWTQKLTQTNFQNYIYQSPNQNPRFSYYNVGHMVVLPVGHMVFGIDPLNKQLLWEKNLTGTSGIPPEARIMPDPQDGTLVIAYQDGWVQRLGQTGPIQPSYVCLQTREGLIAIEPTTGKTLWVRSDVTPRSHVFGDDQYVFIVDANSDGTSGAARALRAYDGVSVKVSDFSALYQRRVRILGRNLLLTDTDPQGNLTLRLHDVLESKDLWKKNFPPGAVVLKSEDPNLAGVVEADGRVTVVDLVTHKEVLKTLNEKEGQAKGTLTVNPKHLDKATAIHLLHDSSNFYLAINGTADPAANPFGGPWPNLVPASGIRTLPVNGEFYAIRRDNAEIRWHWPVQQQMIVLEHFADMPMVLFTARAQKPVGPQGRFGVQQVAMVKSLDKRTGKHLYDQPEIPNGTQFYGLNMDLRAGRIELVGYNMKIIHYLETPTEAAPGSKPGGGVTPGGTTTGGASKPGVGAPPVPADKLKEIEKDLIRRKLEEEEIRRLIEQRLKDRQ